MSNTFVPDVMKFSLISGNIDVEVLDDKYSEIKKKFKFEKVEISENEVNFENGKNIIEVNITDGKCNFMIAAEEKDDTKVVREFMEYICTDSKIILSEIEVISFFKFKKSGDIYKLYSSEILQGVSAREVKVVIDYMDNEKNYSLRISGESENKINFASLYTNFYNEVNRNKTVDDLDDVIQTLSNKLNERLNEVNNFIKPRQNKDEE